MKNGLLVCSGTSKIKNIGDYIQSLASEQYFDHIDCLVEREELSSFYSDDKVIVIMNGWFMWNPNNWPPSECIDPLFISFHLVPDIAEQFLNIKSIEYLKKHSPIGCRDTGTMEILQRYDIPSYFSGCLTLTLGNSYNSEIKKEQVVFVDPYYESSLRTKKEIFKFYRIINDLFRLLLNFKKINKISKKFNYEFVSGYRKISKRLDQLIQVSAFYSAYSSVFSDDMLLKAIYIGHNVNQSSFCDDYEKLNYARNLLRIYAESSLVVTSRIHCALPCLSLNTPVLFVSSSNLEGENPLRSKGRFGGILNLFHTLRYEYNRISIDDIDLNKIIKGRKIDFKTKLINKSDYIEMREKLNKTCTDFVNLKK